MELLERFTAGDTGAFEVLLRRYQRPVYNFIVHATGDLAAAEELTQDVFLRVIERAEAFRGESKFTTWLYTIARNLTVDHGRRARHRKHRSLDGPFRIGGGRGRDSEPPSLIERFSQGDPSPERQVSSQRLQSRMRQAVLALPEDQREVFLMRQVQQLPFRDIAAVVGVSENTVKSRMRYALERLQEALSDWEEMARDAV
jgi:RNA polymerase sigma-70 factor (ECF subfamily)